MTEQPQAGARDESLVRYLTEEFLEDYSQGRLTRREALLRLTGVVGSMALAESLLAACAAPATPAATSAAPLATAAPAGTAAATPEVRPSGVTVPPDDPALTAGDLSFPGEGATLLGYLARPQAEGRYPAVLVCHENRGLTEHIRDVARRFAREGYVALAVDLLARLGGIGQIADPAQIPGLLGNMPADQLVGDFRSALAYLQAQPYVRPDRIGMTGFCFGGGVTWRCATRLPELKAAIPFYGPNPPLEDVPNIRAAVLAVYGEKDTRITAGAAAIEAAMREQNKVFEKIIYPNAEHAFFNDTGQRYNAEAARDAWTRMLAWFEKYLKG